DDGGESDHPPRPRVLRHRSNDLIPPARWCTESRIERWAVVESVPGDFSGVMTLSGVTECGRDGRRERVVDHPKVRRRRARTVQRVPSAAEQVVFYEDIAAVRM